MTDLNNDDPFAMQVKRLQAMGFPDGDINRAALFKTEGKINAAVDLIVSGAPLTPITIEDAKHYSHDESRPPLNPLLTDFDPLLRKQPSSANLGGVSPGRSPTTQTYMRKFKPLPPPEQHKIFQLHQMGFKQEGKSRDALNRTKGNVDAAVALLLEKGDELNEDYECTNPLPKAGTGLAPFSAPLPSTSGAGSTWTSSLQELNAVNWGASQNRPAPSPASNAAAQSLTWNVQPPSYQPPSTGQAWANRSITSGYAPMLSNRSPQPQAAAAPPPINPFEDPFADDFRIDK
ncbi:uncharacterized protein EV422DRAFT_521417 [Fimicolochytrium jonesii]|uniref:uncharacterized protein n=1 Tax=Fimicolochytrium jonesii TaxID=1396493 RepID=UPI0022FDD2C7|nr:uncharacterized protein EV422DRAFT_521417 [Fimicolochytrium jonesii]KAI8823551.1 hypothetical protein EV422DRAFT_521417 [Fimicolochytrium jonesii]